MLILMQKILILYPPLENSTTRTAIVDTEVTKPKNSSLEDTTK